MALGTRRKAKIELEAETKGLERSLDRAQKRLRSFGTETEKSMAMGTIGLSLPGRAKKKARERGGGRGAFAGGFAGGIAGSLTGMATGFVANAGDELFDFEKNLVRFGIASGKSTSELAALRAKILEVAKANALASGEVLQGAQTYVDLTGDVAGAEKAMSSFARIAIASGASVSDIAQATAAMQMSGELAAGDIERVWSGMIVQGKAGAVGAKDFAGELSTLMPMMARFSGGTGAQGILDMGAAFQVVRRGAGSASEASTKLQSLVGSLVKNAPKLRTVGVNVFRFNPKTKKRELIAFRDIIGQIAKKRLDAEQLSKVIGTDKESLQALNMLTEQLALYDQLKLAAEDTGAVERDRLAFLQSPAGKVQTAFNNMKIAIAEAMTPERIEAFANTMVKLGDAVAHVVRGFGYMAEAGKAVLAAHDPGAAYAEAFKRDYLTAAAGLSPEGKRKKAEQLLAASKKDDGDDYYSVAKRTSKELAAQELFRQSDVFTYEHNRSRADINIPLLTKSITDALAKANITVKMDDSTVAKKVDNAAKQRQPTRSR